MSKVLKNDTTITISFRIDEGLGEKLKAKYGRKLSVKVIPYLKKLVK